MKPSELNPHRLGLIGGTGALALFEPSTHFVVTTPWGDPSSALAQVHVGPKEKPQGAWMIARHGNPHRIPPHCVNYRANVYALKEAGVEHIIAINAVGGIHPDHAPGDLVLVDQIIDYTWGRAHTFSDGPEVALEHIEFANPFEGPVRGALGVAAQKANINMHARGCYGATQGPRLETAAEIQRLKRDGCDVVGMTGMPEAALAKELGLDYACLCVVANPAAGLAQEPISMEALHAVLDEAIAKVGQVLAKLELP